MNEQGQSPVMQEAKKMDAGTTQVPDFVKVGDSERRTPEASRAVNIASATMEFLDDVRKANLVAKKELGELATTRIGKAIAVGAVGGGLEYLSEQALGLALGKLFTLLPSKTPADMKHVSDFLNSRFVREAIEDAGVYVLYKKGNELIGKELPNVPVSYLGAAVGVNALDWAVRDKFNRHKPLTSTVSHESYTDEKSNQTTRYILTTTPPADPTNTVRRNRLDVFPRTAGKLADLSNPVTLYGTVQVVEGVSAYVRAVREIRNARKIGGEKRVEMLVTEAKKAKPVGAKRDKQERILDVLEKAAQDNSE